MAIRGFWLLTASAMTVVPVQAFAQVQTPADWTGRHIASSVADNPGRNGGDEPDGLADPGETVVVTGRYTIADKIDTATGLGLTVRETPQSVSILTAQRIIDQNLTSIVDVVENGAGVTARGIDDVRNQFFARGFEIRNYQIDGVPAAWALSGGSGETLADVSIYDRVEIVRGATGLLSGAGDPSASINLVRKRADKRGWSGYITGGYGTWNRWNLSGDIGGALSGDARIRARAVARYERGDSQIDDYHNEKSVLYGTVEADITDTTLLRAGISHQEGKPRGQSWGNLPSFYTDGSFIVWPRSRSTSAQWAYWNTTNQNIFASLQQQLGTGWSLTANYNRLSNSQSAQLLYMYGLVDKATGTIEGSNPYKGKGDSIQNSFDIQIKGRVNAFGRDHELVVGGLHSIQNRDDDTFATTVYPANVQFVKWDKTSFPDPQFSTTPFAAVRERIIQKGVYGALRLNLADPFKIIAGGRLATWRKSGFSFGARQDYGADNVFIPYVGALLDLTPNHRVYASYTRIFQPQNLVDRNLNPILPLTGNAYEIGIKSAFLNDAVQASAAIFRIDQDNVGQTDIMVVPPQGGLPQQTYVAVNGTRSQGYELEISGRPLRNWNISAGYSDFSAKTAKGLPLNTDQARQLFKLFTSYTFDRLTLGGGVNYRGDAYRDGDNPVTKKPFRFQQDGYALVNLMGRFAVNDHLQIQANIENLLDKTYYSQIGSFSQYRYGEGRNATVSATYRF